MGYCTNCGNELKDGTKFCPKCGKPVTVQQPQNDSSEKSSNYSIELISIAFGRENEVFKTLMDLLKIELLDARIKAFSAPCSIAKGLSRGEAEIYVQKMENAGALVVMRNNGEIVSRTENQIKDELDKEDLGCFGLALSFLIPIVALLIYAYNWRDKPGIAESALLAGTWGILISSIIAMCIWGSVLFHS